MTSDIDPNADLPEAPPPRFKFSWSHKGHSPENITTTLHGTGVAPDVSAALAQTNTMLRKRFPTMVWMRGNKLEGSGVSYGPSVRMNKTPLPPHKPARES